MIYYIQDSVFSAKCRLTGTLRFTHEGGGIMENVKTDAFPSDSGCKVILITSCKGGVGKSTVAANLAYALAKKGKRTLVIDCDFSNRSLDLIFGYEDMIIYDICDVVLGRTTIERAAVKSDRSDNLFFCAAPFELESEFTREQFDEAIEKAKSALSLDFILIDTSCAAGDTLKLVSHAASEALVVVSHQPTATRAAERTGMMLDELGLTEQKLIVNSFDSEAVLEDIRIGINELIDRTNIGIIGIVPYAYRLSVSQEYGLLCADVDNDSEMKRLTAAFDNIAGRVCGESVPLLKKVYGGKKRRQILSR